MTTTIIKVGDPVRWDGAGFDAPAPRWYTGTVTEIRGGLAVIKHDGYHDATSTVRVSKLKPIRE